MTNPVKNPAVFRNDLRDGEALERELDALFSPYYRVQPATPEMQRFGIDRIFFGLRDPFVWTVEYKSDSRSGETGNAFIETTSVDRDGKIGWAYTSRAQLLVYWIVGGSGARRNKVMVLPMSSIKLVLIEWIERFPMSKPVKNVGYNTSGVVVPLNELERLSIWDLYAA